MLNSVVQVISFAFLLGASSYFGYVAKPTEMGLSILASVLALAFANIEKFKRFKGAGFEAEMRDRVDAMVAKEAEPPPSSQALGFTAKGFGLDDKTRRVVMALGNSTYTWRSISGITQEAGVPTPEAKNAISWLSENDLVIATDVGKRVNWGLTEEGRELFNAIAAASPEHA